MTERDTVRITAAGRMELARLGLGGDYSNGYRAGHLDRLIGGPSVAVGLLRGRYGTGYLDGINGRDAR